MALYYSGGIGILYDKEIEQSIAKVSYQLTETDPTKYTRKKWWGEFYISKEIKKSGTYRIESEDGRNGECVVWADTEIKQASASHYHYHFNGRSKLGRGSRSGRS